MRRGRKAKGSLDRWQAGYDYALKNPEKIKKVMEEAYKSKFEKLELAGDDEESIRYRAEVFADKVEADKRTKFSNAQARKQRIADTLAELRGETHEYRESLHDVSQFDRDEFGFSDLRKLNKKLSDKQKLDKDERLYEGLDEYDGIDIQYAWKVKGENVALIKFSYTNADGSPEYMSKFVRIK